MARQLNLQDCGLYTGADYSAEKYGNPYTQNQEQMARKLNPHGAYRGHEPLI